MLELAKLTPDGLAQASLSDLAQVLLAPNPEAFGSVLSRLDPAAATAEVDQAERAFGWKLPAEVRSYLLIEQALSAAAEALETDEVFWRSGDRSLQLVLPTVEYMETLLG